MIISIIIIVVVGDDDVTNTIHFIFWIYNSICELLGTPETEISTTMLSLPTTGAEVDKEACNYFTIVIE